MAGTKGESQDWSYLNLSYLESLLSLYQVKSSF